MNPCPASRAGERLTLRKAMDPQLRLLLESVYEATEDGECPRLLAVSESS